MTQTFEHGYAAVIGVDQNNIQRLALPTVAKDVRSIYEVLVHPERCAYDPENVRLVYGEDATRREIMDTLIWLQEKVEADPEATAILYYSGHGMVDKKKDQYYLIPYDIRSLNQLRSDAIRAEDFNAGVADIDPRRMLILLDCCHAAGMDVKNVDLDAEDTSHLKQVSFPMDLPETKDVPTFEEGGKGVEDLATGSGRAILNSSTGAESSYIRRDGKMSLFTYHLIESLTGYAPHDDDDATVLVTDVMSYVTREVAKTAREEGRQQTPMMRTSGVFPVALVLGGEGAKGVERLPEPTEKLPEVPGMNVTFNQAGQTVGGHQVNIGHQEGDIGQIGDTIDTGGGAFVRGGVSTGGGSFVGRDQVTHGDVVHGDQVQGDNIGGDQHVGDSFEIGSVTGEAVGIGSGASVSQTIHQGVPGEELERLFAPLLREVAQSADAATEDEALQKARQLKAEAAKGEDADDDRLANLIQDLAEMAPGAVETLTGLFTNTVVAKAAGGVTRFVLGRLQADR